MRNKLERRKKEVLTKLLLRKQDYDASRGYFETLHLDANHGNFLELMKLIARCDPILENHLKMT